MLSLLALTVFACSHSASAGSAISVSIPISAPSAAPTLDPALLSAPNTFFLNALDNLAQRTGALPWLRIGADSEDHTDFSFRVQISETIFPASSAGTPYPEASNITVGLDYYKLAKWLPAGTHVIWGVNFGTDNLTAAFLEARAITDAFADPALAHVTLELIEVGNEADLYGGNGHRAASTWTIGEYVKEWTGFATNVSAVANLSDPSGPKFFGCAFGDSSHSTSSFSPQGAIASGLLESAPGKLITDGGSNPQVQNLMSKSAIRSSLDAFVPDIAAVHAQGLDYVLGETNSYYGHGAPGVSDSAGAALWALDYTLYAAQLGVKRAHFHEGVGYKRVFRLPPKIQPATLTHSVDNGSALAAPLAPHVQPAYYGALVLGEALGASAARGAVRAVELNFSDAFLAGYAFYDAGAARVARAVLINSQAFLAAGNGTRTSRNVTFAFSGAGEAPAQMAVRRLAIGHADDTSGLRWAGQSFETPDARPSGALSVQTVGVDEGVSIAETEAVLLSFE
ncbi:hypothetical protein DFH11DRAFT_1776844 [Phellopilus nigrolimitatus]|nr:hypothetical protein DFH11DRAFT_1776844 [Phellopilus nigrolimitatus]